MKRNIPIESVEWNYDRILKKKSKGSESPIKLLRRVSHDFSDDQMPSSMQQQKPVDNIFRNQKIDNINEHDGLYSHTHQHSNDPIHTKNFPPSPKNDEKFPLHGGQIYSAYKMSPARISSFNEINNVRPLLRPALIRPMLCSISETKRYSKNASLKCIKIAHVNYAKFPRKRLLNVDKYRTSLDIMKMASRAHSKDIHSET